MVQQALWGDRILDKVELSGFYSFKIMVPRQVTIQSWPSILIVFQLTFLNQSALGVYNYEDSIVLFGDLYKTLT